MIMTIVPSLHIQYYMVTKVGFYSLAIQYTCTIQTTTPNGIPRTTWVWTIQARFTSVCGLHKH